MLLFNPASYDPAFLDENSRAAMKDLVAFFEAKGLAEMKDENQAFMKRVLEIREKLDEVDRDYHAKPEDYLTIYREIDAEWTAKEKTILDLLLDLRKEVTPEEWTPLFTEVHRRSK